MEKYGIDQKNIYTITTDNAANVIKSIKLIEDENMDDEINISETKLDDATELIHLIQEYDWKSDLNIMSVRCAAHTLQLSILDILKNSWHDNITQSYITIIKDARNVVKELRTQNNLLYLRKYGLPRPLINCPTRWNSTYDILEKLLKLKTHCEDCAAHGNGKLYLPPEM